MAKGESAEERAQRIIRELREATAEAAGVLKDLTGAARAARHQVDEYAGEEVGRQLEGLSRQAATAMQKQIEDFMASWSVAKEEACDKAMAHLEDDWRLAVTVNVVGRYVSDALKDAMTHPLDCGCEISIPREISPPYIAGEGHPL